MNLIACQAEAGGLHHSRFRLDVEVAAKGSVTLGQRPEDLRLVAPQGADASGEGFSAELLRDATLVTVRLGTELVIVKTQKDSRVRMGETVGLNFPRDTPHL